jgi:hypothetical protein
LVSRDFLTYSGEDMNESYYFVMIEGKNQRKKDKERETKILKKLNATEGNIYLVKDDNPKLYNNILLYLISLGYKAIFVSKSPEEYLLKKNENSFSLQWMGGIGQYVKQSSFYESIESLLKVSPDKNVFFIEGLNGMIMRNGFLHTLNFVYRLREFTYLKSMISFISVNPNTMKSRDFRLIEKEAKNIEFRFLRNFIDEELPVSPSEYNMGNARIRNGH